MQSLRNVVVADDILIALGHFLLEQGINRFDSSIEKMHQWFFEHREELPCKLCFSNRGFGQDSESLRQAISNLSASRLIYWKSNESKTGILHFEPEVSFSYRKFTKDLLLERGLTEEKLRELAKSFVESCCQQAG